MAGGGASVGAQHISLTARSEIRQVFDASTRSRGDNYFAAGRVRVASPVGEHQVYGEVRGSETYWLDLTFQSGIVWGRCSCPFASESRVPCKHLWALLRAVDANHLLPAVGRTRVVGFELDQEVERHLHEDPDVDLDVNGDPIPQIDRDVAPRSGSAFDLEFDFGIDAALDESHSAVQSPVPLEPREASRQVAPAPLCAVLDLGCSSAAVVVLRLVAPDGHGRYRAVTRTDLNAPREGIDRELALLCATWAASAWSTPTLLGGSSPWSNRDGSGSIQLWQGPQRAFLGRLVEEGRLLVPNEAEQLRAVRRSQDGKARLLLRVVVDRGDAAYGLEPRLVTASGEIGLDGVDLALGWGLVFAGDQLLTVDDPGQATRVARYFDKSAPEQLSFAPDELEALLEKYYAERKPPPLELPHGLELSPAQVEPRPFIDVGAPDGSNQGLPLRAGVRYGDKEVSLWSSGPRAFGRWVVDLVRQVRYARDTGLEDRSEQALTELGARPSWSHPSLDGTACFRVSRRRVPALVRGLLAQGWAVSVERKVYRRMTGFSLRGSSRIDWLEIEGSLDFEGGQLPLGELLRAVRRRQLSGGFVELGDGAVGVAPDALLKKLERLLHLGQAQNGSPEPGSPRGSAAGESIRLSRAHAGAAVALLSSADSQQEDAGFAELRRRLEQGRLPEPARCPRAFRGTLREYQKIGLGWLRWLEQMRFGGCLADDMGLGKTVQILALLAGRGPRRGPSLVVAPRSVVHNWQEEVARFAPLLGPVVHLGPERATTASELGKARLIVTSYATLCRDLALFSDVELDYVVLDEAQAIKNPSTRTSQAVRQLGCRNRLALTGTPIENHLGELWAILDFLNPGFGVTPNLGNRPLGNGPLGDGPPSDSGGLEPAERELVEGLIKPFVLRRTKHQVEPDLPERVEQTLSIELRPAEKRRYQELHRQLRREYSRAVAGLGLERSTPMLLTGLLRLRQAACHQGLIDRSKQGAVSSKLEVLLERLGELESEGAKALVFSQFTQHLDIVGRHLTDAGIRYVRLDGKTTNRAARVKTFQEDPRVTAFLISLKAGGSGLNLTAAEYVFLLDPWWNPAVEAQAIDRCHRIGQSASVVAYRLIAAGTIEEKVAELQHRKRVLSQSVFDNEAAFWGKLTRDDLAKLLE